MMIEGHSNQLVVLLAGCTIIIGVFAYVHARRFWEGLPPVLDAFISMASFIVIIAAFFAGGRIGALWNHPHAGRVIALTFSVIAIRTIRTWLGNEQERHRKARAQALVE